MVTCGGSKRCESVRLERWQAIAEEEDAREESRGDGRLPRDAGRGELMLRDAVDGDVLKFGAGGERRRCILRRRRLGR